MPRLLTIKTFSLFRLPLVLGPFSSSCAFSWTFGPCTFCCLVCCSGCTASAAATDLRFFAMTPPYLQFLCSMRTQTAPRSINCFLGAIPNAKARFKRGTLGWGVLGLAGHHWQLWHCNLRASRYHPCQIINVAIFTVLDTPPRA